MKNIRYVLALLTVLCSGQLAERIFHPEYLLEDIHEEREVYIEDNKPSIKTY